MISPFRRLQKLIAEMPGRSSTILAWVNQGISVSANLAIVPLVLYRVGADAGIWFFLLTWIGLFIILDFGFSQCISRQITFSFGQKGFIVGRPKGRFIRIGGPNAIGRTIVASKTLFRMVSVVIFLIGVLAERTFLFSGHMEASASAHVAWYLIVAAAIIINESRVYGTALSGMLLIPQIRIIGLLQTLLQNGLIVLFLFISPRIELMGLAILITSLFSWWKYRALWIRHKPPGVILKPRKWSMVAMLWRSSWEQGISTAANYFTFAVNPIVIGYLMGAEAVAVYYLPLRISTIFFSSIAEIIGPQVNFMISLYRDHNTHGLLVKFFRIFLVVSVISFFAFSAFALVGPWAIHLWSIGKISPPPLIFSIMALYFFLGMLQMMLGSFIIAHGLQPFARPAVSGGILNVCFMFILIPRMGLVGAALATFLAQLFTSNWFMPWYASRLFKEHFQIVPFAIARRDTLLSLKNDLQSVFRLFVRH